MTRQIRFSPGFSCRGDQFGLSPGGSGLWPIGIRMGRRRHEEPSGGGVVLGSWMARSPW